MAKSKYKCLYCNKKILPTDKYCIYCGQKLDKITDCYICNKKIFVSDKYCIYCGSKMSDYKKCLVCNKTLLKNDKYCIYCGEKQSIYKKCSNCDKTLFETDKYCIYCGNKCISEKKYKTIDIVENSKTAKKESTTTNSNVFKTKNDCIKEETVTQCNEKSKGIPSFVWALFFIVGIISILFFTLFKSYKINYYNVESITNNNPTSYRSYDGYIKFNNISKDGYTFDGWYEDTNYLKRVKGLKEGSRGDVNLYAKWTPIKYTITYDLDGGVNSFLNPNCYYIDSDKIELKEPTKEGHIFDGWYKNNDKIISIESGSTGNVTLKAKWIAKKFKINYSDVFDLYNPNPTTISADEHIYLKDLVGDREGYKFEGWTIDYSNTITELKNVLNDVYIYAKWKAIDYYISYINTDNRAGNPSTYNIYSSITLKSPTRNGYTFDGWYYDDSRITSIYNMTGNIILEARWTPKDYYIYYYNTYDAYNSNPSSYTFDDGRIYLDEIERDGYDFLGWYDSYGRKVSSIKAESDGNISLYAKWELIHDYQY